MCDELHHFHIAGCTCPKAKTDDPAATIPVVAVAFCAVALAAVALTCFFLSRKKVGERTMKQ